MSEKNEIIIRKVFVYIYLKYNICSHCVCYPNILIHPRKELFLIIYNFSKNDFVYFKNLKKYFNQVLLIEILY